MRKIKFKLLTQNELVVVETSARTFGELKAEVETSEFKNVISFNNNQFIERANKTVYGKIDEAVLPATDCIMFVSPLETKLGACVDDMSYTEVRDYVIQLNKEKGAKISILGSTATLKAKVKEFLGQTENVAQETSKDETESVYDSIVRHANTIISLVGDLQKFVKSQKNEETKVVIKVTTDDLQQEAEMLKKLLK